MPLIITRIEPQKKKKNRFSLYSGHNFIIGVADRTLLDFDLHCGLELTDEILEKIKKKEYTYSLREQAFRFLARRPHSSGELRTKLIEKGFKRDSISELIAQLKEKNYLNDNDFTRLYIQDELRLKKSGPLIIKHKLRRKGIDQQIIEDFMAELYPEEIQFKNCTLLAQKKLNSLNVLSTDNIKNRLATFLKQKGFSWETIKPVIIQVIQQDEDEAI
jgi:regulatory protein